MVLLRFLMAQSNNSGSYIPLSSAANSQQRKEINVESFSDDPTPFVTRLEKWLRKSPMVIVNQDKKWFSYCLIIIGIVFNIWRLVLSVAWTMSLDFRKLSSTSTQMWAIISVSAPYAVLFLRQWYFGRRYNTKQAFSSNDTLNKRVKKLCFAGISLYIIQMISAWTIYAFFTNYVCFYSISLFLVLVIYVPFMMNNL